MNGLIAEPVCRRAWIARLNWLISWLKPPVIARTRPVWGSSATIAPETRGILRSPKCGAVALPPDAGGLAGNRADLRVLQGLARPLHLLEGDAALTAISEANGDAVAFDRQHHGEP